MDDQERRGDHRHQLPGLDGPGEPGQWFEFDATSTGLTKPRCIPTLDAGDFSLDRSGPEAGIRITTAGGCLENGGERISVDGHALSELGGDSTPRHPFVQQFSNLGSVLIGPAVPLIGPAFAFIGPAITIVGSLLPLISGDLALVCQAVAVVGGSLAVVGLSITRIGCGLAQIGRTMTLPGSPVTPTEQAISFVGGAVAMVCGSLPIVGCAVATVGSGLPLVGYAVAVVGGCLPIVGRTARVHHARNHRAADRRTQHGGLSAVDEDEAAAPVEGHGGPAGG